MTQIKSEKGLTGVDLTVAVILIMMLLSVILSLFYNNYINSQATKRNAEANSFITNLFTYAESLKYEETTKDKLETYINDELGTRVAVVEPGNESDFSEGKPYVISVKVTSYKDLPENEGKEVQDYLRLIEATVGYRVGDKIEKETFKTVKVIER